MPTLRDVMIPTAVTLTPDMPLAQAAARLQEHHVSGAAVVDGGLVVGVLSNTDLERAIAATQSATALTSRALLQREAAEREVLASAAHRAERVKSNGSLGVPWATPAPSRTAPLLSAVKDVMTTRVASLPADADVSDAVALMQRENLHRVLVMDRDEVVGIVTALDLANVVLQ